MGAGIIEEALKTSTPASHRLLGVAHNWLLTLKAAHENFFSSKKGFFPMFITQKITIKTAGGTSFLRVMVELSPWQLS